MKYDKYDLLVAGTGPASTFFIKKYLSKARASVKVLVLERGDFYSHADRLKKRAGDTSHYKKAASKPRINNEERGWAYTIGFGGSSNCWYACTPRFLPSDFRMKTLYGVANDWPISYEELDPYYTEVEELMSISGPDETPFPRQGSYPLPPHILTTVDKVLNKKYGKLYISQPTGRASRPVNGRNACCASGVCGTCPVNAKFTIENSNIGVYEDPRVEVIYGAQVYSLELANNVVRKVNFIQEGKERQAEAEVFALGTHAIFNPHILLNSGDSNPFTGKGLGEQYGLQAVVYLDNMPNLGGSTWVTANGYMLYDGVHRKDHAACLMESSNSPEWIRVESGKWRNLISFRMIFEDLPMEQNFVSATPEDLLTPTTVFKGISSYTERAVDNMKIKLPEVLSCLPVEKIEYLKPFGSESHILGTTRMSADAKDGVVDKNLIHHQYRNLFVLGSGSFTTYSPANPTLTLSALSLYAADHAF